MEVSFKDLFDSPIFTFEVGREGQTQKVQVHSLALTRCSPVLNNIMNGNMLEAQTKTCLVEDFDPDTFKRLCEFGYHGKYTDPTPKRRAEAGTCLSGVSVCETDSQEGADDFEDFEPVLIGHANVYRCADKYQVSSLRSVALSRVRKNLKYLSKFKQNADAIHCLARFAFNDNNTLRRKNPPDPLRELIVNFIAREHGCFASGDQFYRLLQEEGQFAPLFWRAIKDNNVVLSNQNSL